LPWIRAACTQVGPVRRDGDHGGDRAAAREADRADVAVEVQLGRQRPQRADGGLGPLDDLRHGIVHPLVRRLHRVVGHGDGEPRRLAAVEQGVVAEHQRSGAHAVDVVAGVLQQGRDGTGRPGWVLHVHRQHAGAVAAELHVALQPEAFEKNVQVIEVDRVAFEQPVRLGRGVLPQLQHVGVQQRRDGLGVVLVVQRQDQVAVLRQVGKDRAVGLRAQARHRQVRQVDHGRYGTGGRVRRRQHVADEHRTGGGAVPAHRFGRAGCGRGDVSVRCLRRPDEQHEHEG
jgi:hypothetical protein